MIVGKFLFVFVMLGMTIGLPAVPESGISEKSTQSRHETSTSLEIVKLSKEPNCLYLDVTTHL